MPTHVYHALSVTCSISCPQGGPGGGGKGLAPFLPGSHLSGVSAYRQSSLSTSTDITSLVLFSLDLLTTTVWVSQEVSEGNKSLWCEYKISDNGFWKLSESLKKNPELYIHTPMSRPCSKEKLDAHFLQSFQYREHLLNGLWYKFYNKTISNAQFLICWLCR